MYNGELEMDMRELILHGENGTTEKIIFL